MLIQVLGYDVYAKLKDSTALEKIGHFLITNPREGVICGGAAVVATVGREVRQVTPDLDVLITPALVPSVLHVFGNKVTRNRFGFSNVVDGMDVDWLLAVQPWQYAAIETSHTWKNVPVMAAAYLIISKFLSGRDKDKHDLQLLYNRQLGPVDFRTALDLLPKLGLSQYVGDLQQEIKVLELMKRAQLNTP